MEPREESVMNAEAHSHQLSASPKSWDLMCSVKELEKTDQHNTQADCVVTERPCILYEDSIQRTQIINVDVTPAVRPSSRVRSIWVPFAVVVTPALMLPTVLLCLVFGYRIDHGPNAFSESGNHRDAQHQGYYLVALSITRLAIISSCASTLAPFFTAPILLLWRIHTVRSTQIDAALGRLASSEVAALPQLSTLLGLLMGALDEVLKYSFGRCRRPTAVRSGRTTMPRPVHLAAVVASACVFITLSLWAADTVFHSLSSSANIQLFDLLTPPRQSYGHELTQTCKHFNRSDNQCLPCTLDGTDDITSLAFFTRANEMFRISNNISQRSQIQSIDIGLSALLPRTNRVSNNTDYAAQTVGVTATCRPITRQCGMQTLDVHSYTMFNCSRGFHGIIGKPSVLPTTQNFTIPDPETPALNFKPSAYLQYGFYEDSVLDHPYNSVGWNSSVEGWAVLGGQSSADPCPSDQDLPADVHMAVAGRFSTSSAKAGVDLSLDPGLYSKTIYSDFVFYCTLSAHIVDYIWADGAVRNHTMGPTDAGLLNMYIGHIPYYTQAIKDDMTDDVLQMALQSNSLSMADTWAKLFSSRVLSVIGAYTDPAPNIKEQVRHDVLVAKVHIGGLWFLVSCSFGTALFASWIAFRGLWLVHVHPEICEQARDLSFSGMLDRQLAVNREARAAQQVADNDKGALAAVTMVDEAKSMLNNQSSSQSSIDPALPIRSFTGCSETTTVVPGVDNV